MAKICTVLLSLLAFSFPGTLACPSECTCSETNVTCSNLNALPDASDLFTDPSQVETVSITDSPSITQIPESFFSDMPKLATVTLTDNGLSSLNELSFRYLPMLSTIDVSGNPLNCAGSENEWIKTWLAAVDTSTLTGTCADNREFNFYTDYIDDVIPVSLSFDSTEYMIEESEGTRTITVTRSGDTLAPLNVRVMVEMLEGSEDDFTISNKQLTIATGESSTSFDLSVIDNAKKDPDGWGFTLQLVPESIIIRSGSATVALVDDDPNATVPPVVNTTPGITNATESPKEPLMGSSPAMMSTTEAPSGGGSKAWIIVVIIVILAVIVVVVFFVWKKKQDRKRTSASPGQGDYSAVQKDSDGKVYSATTEEIA